MSREVRALHALLLFIVIAGGTKGIAGDSAIIAWGNPGGAASAVPAGLTNIVAIAAGTFNSLAIKEDGALAYWGSNPYDPASNTNLPAGLTNISSIAIGYAHNLALRRDGCVIAWGAGTLNATGLLDHAQSVVPPDLTNAMAIAAGSDFSLALRSNGTAMAWGSLSNVPPNLGEVTAIAAGSTHALALRADGTVTVWRNEVNYNPSITNMPAGLSNVVAIAAGDAFSLALKSDGDVVGWGFNNYGQIAVPSGLSNVIGIACGKFHSLAIRDDRTVVAWGAGVSGSNSWPHAGQSIVPFGLTNVSAVSGGYFYSLALNDGSPVIKTLSADQTNYTGTTISFSVAAEGLSPLNYQWQFNGMDLPGQFYSTLVLTNVGLDDAGPYRVIVRNGSGELASPEASLVLSTSEPIILKHPASLSCLLTSNCTFSVLAAGSLPISYQWRLNGEDIIVGEAGSTLSFTNVQMTNSGDYDVVLSNEFGSKTSMVATLFATPSFVVGWGDGGFGKTNHPAGLVDVVAVAAGNIHSLALQGDGTVKAWGGNPLGQTNVPANLSNVIAIAAGQDFNVALKSDGRVVAWGDNSFGQTNVPLNLTNAVAIAAGDMHAVALRQDGTLTGWGYFYVFDRTIRTPFWTPNGLTNVIAVATGSEYGYALKNNGIVIRWGYSSGVSNVAPVFTNAVAIAAGAWHCLVLRSNGTVVSLPSIGWRTVPPSLSNVVAIAAGSYHSVALKNDGTVVAWGANYPVNQTNVPAGLGNVVAIAACENHTLAVRDLRPAGLPVAQPLLSDGVFSLSLPSLNNRAYSLEYKDALDQNTWLLLCLAAGTGDALTLQDPRATNALRFYRVRQW